MRDERVAPERDDPTDEQLSLRAVEAGDLARTPTYARHAASAEFRL